MKIVNIHAAKTQLSRLIAEVLAGEEVVISKAGTPLVRLVPTSTSDEPRRLGALSGAVTESADCWAPDNETAMLFYSGDVEPASGRRVAESSPAWYARPNTGAAKKSSKKSPKDASAKTPAKKSSTRRRA